MHAPFRNVRIPWIVLGHDLQLRDNRIGFLDIAKIVEETLQTMNITPINELEAVTTSDAAARRIAEEKVKTITR